MSWTNSDIGVAKVRAPAHQEQLELHRVSLASDTARLSRSFRLLGLEGELVEQVDVLQHAGRAGAALLGGVGRYRSRGRAAETCRLAAPAGCRSGFAPHGAEFVHRGRQANLGRGGPPE